MYAADDEGLGFSMLNIVHKRINSDLEVLWGPNITWWVYPEKKKIQ